MRGTTWRNGGRRVILPAIALGLLLSVAGCADENPVSPTPAPQPSVTAQSISINGVTALQRPGDTSQLTAIVTFSDGTARDVSSQAGWEMDYTGVAYVSRTGLVTARAYGQCNITARYGTVSARAAVRVLPEGMFLLSGHVYEESGMPLWQARVSIPSATSDLTASTSWEGAYTLPARGDTDVRAEMEGFDAQVKRLTVSADQALDFHLKFKAGGFGGMYRLAFIASPSCTLPADAMRRTYIARVEEKPEGAVVVVLSGAEFSVWGVAGFTGSREGSSVRFDITGDYSFDYQFIEMLDLVRELVLTGTATGQVGQTFDAVFVGSVVVRRWSDHAVLAQCEAGHHRLEFTR